MQRREFTSRLVAGGLTGGLATGPWRRLFACEQEAAPSSPGSPGTPGSRVADGTAVSVTSAAGRQAVVATVHPLATQAALRAFSRGGNAVDAAIAASAMLSVVDGHNSGLGGGGLALVRLPDGSVHCLDGRERAPLSVQPDTFMRGGKPDPELSQTGPLAAGTPGLVALLDQLSRRFGAQPWNAALLDAAEVADRGFAIDRVLASSLAASAATLAKFPESARVLLDEMGNPPAAGQTLTQTDLARTLRQIAEQGAAWFYEGEFAERTEAMMRDARGLLSRRDFAEYRAVRREPVQVDYREHRIYGFPPPSSGGIHIAQMLGMLSHWDFKALFETSPAAAWHLLAEVMKRAMADRAHWLGDADFVGVPSGLVDPDYLTERARDVDLQRAVTVESHGRPASADAAFFEAQKHTTHLTTADADGTVVALTQTINTSFGSKMIVPGTGVVLNNEMDDFSLAPGVRNAFGLLGAEANAVAPGKRPLSSMSPSLAVDHSGQWRLTCGAAGGPRIITVTLQNLVRCLDLGQDIATALASPRVHHQWSPDTLYLENRVPDALAAELQQRGHRLQRVAALAVAQGISRDSSGQMTAASDPRVPSAAGAL
jgi:gamma-glutamyltranspeptidase / glutathione hydrolase